MNIGLFGKKVGMTQIPLLDGKLLEVTAISVAPNLVSQVKTKEKDGYQACQLAYWECRVKLLNKPQLGHLKKGNLAPQKHLAEIRNMDGSELGSQIDLSIFQEGEKIKVTGNSKGKGFTGVIAKGQSCGPMAHGSGYHRGVGSLCPGRNANRTFKGKVMPGRVGNQKVTVNNLKIVKILPEKQIILVKGAVPGNKKGWVRLVKTK